MNITTTTAFLRFRDDNGDEEIVSIDSILNSGYPIDSESGEDMELISTTIVDRKGQPILR
jgi:hypothetical protein